ncbi:ASPIC/UnbV domain-containing protein [Acidovorax sp.]|uniref:ASPIC/UnbV domain-containing protein n=1 Tax=Acidovorax sp. TaxID=1872122 RepID=UPI00262B6485|nr:ASPIC/UnbV domain-containing protein [Acidovorax sp.]HQT00237.1 ASPIC/UnbV domain-containing protein [Thiobacillus sp.]
MRGTVSNRHGLGAGAKLIAGGKTRSRQHIGPSHFTSLDSQPVHFGRGTSSQADSIEIACPSGWTSLLTHVPASTLVWVDEP